MVHGLIERGGLDDGLHLGLIALGLGRYLGCRHPVAGAEGSYVDLVVAPGGEGLLLTVAELDPGHDRRFDGDGARPQGPVQLTGQHRGPPQGGHLGGQLPLAPGPELLHELVPGGHELARFPAVEEGGRIANRSDVARGHRLVP